MTATGALTVARRADAFHPRLVAPRVGKAADANALHGERRDNARQQHDDGRENTQAALSRSGTEACEPLWYGPQLRPAFVAQILGQIMQPGARSVPPQVYQRRLPASLLFDARA